MGKAIQIYLIPAAVFSSVLLGGGYGTGREVVQFFTHYGPLGGLLAIACSVVVFSLVLAATFEFSRTFRVYDYRSFFQELIGPFWILFEILYILLFMMVLGVVSAAAGNILEDRFNIPSVTGLVAMPILVTLIVLFGRMMVERALAFWSIVMYGVFVAYFIIILNQPEVGMLKKDVIEEVKPGWLIGGALFAMYNLAVAPAMLFAIRAIETRKQAFISATIAAMTIFIPALLFHLSYVVGYPHVLDEALPNYWMINQYAPDWFLVLFIVALLGTLIETGVGMVQSMIERFQKTGEENELSMQKRAAVALLTTSLAAMLGTLGVIEIIGKGYTFMSYGFSLVYVLPICTIGVYKFTRRNNSLPNFKGELSG